MAGRSLRVIVSLALMAALIAVFLWNVELDEVAAALERTRPWLIVASVALALATYWFRAVRWQLILRPSGRVRHSSAVLATIVGYTAMTLLPARIGDVVRPVALARRDRLPVSAALASILTERIFDLWTVVAYFLVFLLRPPEMAELDARAAANLEILRISGYVFGAGLALGTLALVGLLGFQERFVALAIRPVGWFSKRWQQPVASFLGHFLDGLRVLQRPRDLALVMGASLLLWYGIFWQVKVTLLAFQLDLPLRVSYLLITMAVIGLAIPTPGGVGGFHKAIQVGLTAFFGVELNLATAIALVHHAICFLPITAIGLLMLPLIGVRWGEVGAMSSEVSKR